MATIHTIGRRKASVAKVFLAKGKGNIIVNKRKLNEYFSLKSLQSTVYKPLDILDISTIYPKIYRFERYIFGYI